MKTLLPYFVLCTLVFSFLGCKKNSSEEDMLALNKARASAPAISASGYSKNLVISEEGFAQIKSDIASSSDAQAFIANNITQDANTALGSTPQPISTLPSADYSLPVTTDANLVYKSALQFFLFQENENAAEYRDRSRDIILAWVDANNVSTEHTPNETYYLGFFHGYSLIRAFIDEESRVKIDNWFIAKYNVYKNAAVRTNNWETIRGLFMLEIAYMVDNVTYISEAKAVLQAHFNQDTRIDGANYDFVHRDAFAYHAYNLNFIGMILRSIAVHDGIQEATNWVNNRTLRWRAGNGVNGGTIADQIKFWVPYLTDPSNNVHYEFANTLNSPDLNRSDYNTVYRPTSTYYALNQMLFAMNEQVNDIYRIVLPTRTRYNGDLNYYLNSFGFTAVEEIATQIFVYSDVNYSTLGVALSAGNYTLAQMVALGIPNDNLSSVGVPEGMRVTLYENDNFTGNNLVLTEHTANLTSLNFNDKASSIKVEKL